MNTKKSLLTLLVIGFYAMHAQEDNLKTGLKIVASVPFAKALVSIEAACKRKFQQYGSGLYSVAPLNMSEPLEDLAHDVHLPRDIKGNVVEEWKFALDDGEAKIIQRDKLLCKDLPKTFKRYAFYRNLAGIYLIAGAYYVGRGLYDTAIKK